MPIIQHEFLALDMSFSKKSIAKIYNSFFSKVKIFLLSFYTMNEIYVQINLKLTVTKTKVNNDQDNYFGAVWGLNTNYRLKYV